MAPVTKVEKLKKENILSAYRLALTAEEERFSQCLISLARCCALGSSVFEVHSLAESRVTPKMAGVVGMTAPRIQIFRPTMEEFNDFPGYINYMESRGAHKAGLAKVIPPKEWVPRRNGYDDIGHLVIPSPISQMVTGRQGLYQQYNIQKRSMTVKEFQKVANSDNFRTPEHFDYEDLERKYWKNVTYNSPIYGADVSGSLYDEGVKEWNINHLNTILDCVSGDYGIKIDGVNTAYLYFGMWKTSFAWHTEDMDLYSINYLHFGCPKSWYVIPPEHGKRLERLANGFFCQSFKSCPAFLRHKMTIISPPILKQYSIPYDKITQEPGEFMVTFPYGYHAGYNHGFNCAESTNFATERWVEYGKRASQCTCRKDSVKISMDTFVKRFQPDRYELWRIGKDVGPHPEDPSRCTAAPPPSKCELVLNNRPKITEKRRKMMNCVSKRHPISSPPEMKKAKTVKRTSDSSGLEVAGTTNDHPGSLIKDDEDDDEGDDDDQKQHVRGEKCHVVISKANGETNEYRATLGGLVKLEDGELSLMAAATTVVTRREPVISMLPGTVHKLQAHVVRRSPPSEIKMVQEYTPKISVFSGRAYKSILIKPQIKVNSSSVKQDVMSPATLTPPLSGDDDPSSSRFDHQITVYDYNNYALFNGTRIDMMKPQLPATAEISTHADKDRCSLRDSSSAKKSCTNELPEPRSSISSDQVASTATTSFDVLNSSPTYPSELSTKLKSEYVVLETNDEAIVAENTHASVGEANNSVVFDRSGEPTSACSEPTSIASDSNRMFGDEVVRTATDLPIVVTAVDQPSELSPPLLSPASPDDLKVGASVAIKESDVLMPNLPREPRCVTPTVVNQPFIEDDIDVTKDSWWSHAASEEWAKPLSKLWQHKLTNFDAEMAFNEFCAETEPHCSICSLFAPQQFKGLELDIEGHSQKANNIPSCSRVLMPEAVFLSASRHETGVRLGESRNTDEANSVTAAGAIGSLSPISGSMSNVDDNGCSRLLVCEDCKVCVHASCYGVLNYDSSLGMRWRCSRCIRQNVNAECCLCVLRGGALKPTTDGRWAHVVCTLVVHDVFFETVPSREPVNISRITLARLELNCVFCRQLVRRCGRFSGACIQCTATGESKCTSAFHVTCGIAAGVKFEACDWPELIQVSCPKHNDEKKREDLQQPELAIGQTVISKYRNNRYYHCVVSEKVTKVFYSVDFDATTSCDNLYPVDVESRDCLRDGPPAVDEQISVRWTDNKVYDAVFRGTNTVVKYEVTFEDGSRRVMDPEHIYAMDEELPKRVKARLSTATARKHLDAFPVEEAIAHDGSKKKIRRAL